MLQSWPVTRIDRVAVHEWSQKADLEPRTTDRQATAREVRFMARISEGFANLAPSTPGLRGVGQTAPYMHNGSLRTLRDVVRFYSELDEDRLHADGEKILKPLRLTDGEISDLVAFLESLSSEVVR
jgi:cytochrome c peroxidase